MNGTRMKQNLNGKSTNSGQISKKGIEEQAEREEESAREDNKNNNTTAIY